MLESANGHKIQRSLACTDLFSLDVAGDKRANLETLFQRYEESVSQHSRSLIQKVSEQNFADLKRPLLNVFVSKFLNFLRNPYCVEKVLNTVGSTADFYLTDSSHRATFDALNRE